MLTSAYTLRQQHVSCCSFGFVDAVFHARVQEEIAAVNLAKYRKMQHDLEESEARAEMAENVVGQMRSKGRTPTVTETISVCTAVSHTDHGSLNSSTAMANG